MIGDVVMSSMNTKPLSKNHFVLLKNLFQNDRGRRGINKGKGMGLALKPLDSGTPYGRRLCYGFALLRAGE